MVMQEVLVLIGAGLALGVPLAVILSRLVRKQLYGLQPTDPATIAGSALLLIVSAGIAGLIPALRASRVHPSEALRCE
jgi:ABC-type antimicrobial peptide transport system permease subunit